MQKEVPDIDDDHHSGVIRHATESLVAVKPAGRRQVGLQVVLESCLKRKWDNK